MIRHRLRALFRASNQWRRGTTLALVALAGVTCLIQPALTSNNCPQSFSGSFDMGAGSSFTLTFQGSNYNAMTNQTTVCYVLDATPDNESLSHFVIELCPALRLALVPSNDYEAVNPDPTTGISGVKFDNNPGEDTYCFTVNGNWPLGCTRVSLKKGSDDPFPTGPIVGLACNATLMLSCPQNITVNCGCASGQAVTFPAPTPTGGTPPFTVVCRNQLDQAVVQSGDVFPLGTTTVVCTVTDVTNASATCSFTITVNRDTVAPQITCPANVDIDCAASTDPADTGRATATDACDSSPTITFSDVEVAGNCPTGGKRVRRIRRTWTATDDCGNASTCVQIIDLRDNTPPMLTCPANVTVQCNESTEPSATGTATATDNCTTATVTYSDQEAAGDCLGTKTITRTWTATDGCSNTSTCTQTIRVRDTTNPVITCPANVNVQCGESTAPADTGMATATDNCGGTPAITFVDSEEFGTCPNYRVITRRWTATDACGNTDSCNQRINIRDRVAPMITCPANAEVPCGGSTDPANTGTATATDNCGATPTITYSDSEPTGNCPTVFTRTWTATDACQNTATCTQTITLGADSAPPTITCPADVTVDCEDSTDPSATGRATATDICDPSPEITYSDETVGGNCPGNRTITRTWTARDDCNNTNTCVQTITVRDITDPEITCPANATVQCGQSTDPAATGSATATDNCDTSLTPTYSDVVTPGNCPGNSTIARTWTVMDDCGNDDSCVQTITVVDTSAPSISCPTLEPVNLTGTCQTTIPNVCATVMATATDNCSSAGQLICSQQPMGGTMVGAGEHTITVTVKDACNNTATCTTTFEVICDDFKITCPVRNKIEICSDEGADSYPGDCGAVVTFGTPTVMGGAAPVTVSCQPPSGSLFPVGKTKVTCTATDAGGNTVTCSFNVVVKDCEDPKCKAPYPLTVNAGKWCKYLLEDLCDQVGKKDNCGAGNVTCSQYPAPGTYLDEGTHTITFTLTDKAGNTSTCTTTVTVECQRELEITCPVEYRIEVCSDEGVDKKAGDCGAIVTFGTPTVTGGKQPVTVSCLPKSGSFFTVGTTKVTCVATDADGVKDLCSFYVIVNDCEAPLCSGGYPIKVTGDAYCKAKLPDVCAKITKSDNCGAGNLTCTQYPAAGTVVGQGMHTVTVTVKDKAGNTSTCTAVVEVVCPTQSPLTISCPTPDIPEIRCSQGYDKKPGDCGAVVTFGAPTVSGGKGPVTVSCTPKSGSFFPVGTTKVTCTATDASGKKVTCYFYVTVMDNEAPKCKAPAARTVTGDAYCKAKLPDLCALVMKSDNCTPSANITCTQYPAAGTVLGKGAHTISFTLKDASGNTTTCTTTFTVKCRY